jgi:hypothetical protein
MRLFILLLTLSLSCAWVVLPDKYTDKEEGENHKIGFVLDPIRIRVDTYVWMLCEHLVIVGQAFVIFRQERVFLRAMAVYLGLQAVDTIGWVLAYDDPLKGLPFTFNVAKIFIFLAVIIIELYPLWKEQNYRRR